MRGIWRIRRVAKRIRNQYKRWKQREAQKDLLIYWGNGASRIIPSDMAKMDGILIQENGAGMQRLSVYQSVGKRHDRDEIHEFYEHENGEFLGYHVRKKIKGIWKWMTEDGQWYSSSELAADVSKKKRVYQGGERIGDALEKGETLYLIAQWRNPINGDMMQDGYSLFCNRYLIHAFGDYKGQKYSNTREALEDAYAKGYRYFETDVKVIMPERKMVLSHGWNENTCKKTGMVYKPEFENMTGELFMQQKIKGMHVMDGDDLREFMKAHPDTYFEIDFFRGKYKTKTKALLKTFENDMELLDRMVIQTANRESFDDIDQIHHFKNYQVILRPEWVDAWEDNIDYAYENGIATIAISKARLKEDYIKVLQTAGLNVMVYTFKQKDEQTERLLSLGVNTICIDHAS